MDMIALGWRTLSPSGLVLALAVTQVVTWTIAPTLVHSAPPLDVVESALWGREEVLLSYKHPNLPGLLIEAGYRLTGAYGWPDFLLSQLFIAATYGFVYRLGRELIGARAAAAGTLLLAGCFYFSWPTPEFNHNVAQMPIWAAIAFFLWRAAARNALWLWLVAGLLAALGMYAKFSTGVLLLCGGVWLLADPRGRACLSTYKPWLGLGLFGAASLPLAVRLVETGYRPLLYAEKASAGGAGILHFLSTQLADCAAMLVIVLLAFPWRRRTALAGNLTDRDGVDEATALRFLLIVGLGPLFTTALIALAHGTEDMWGAPMLNLIGLLAMLALRRRLSPIALRRIAAAALFLAVVVPLAYAGIYVARLERGEPHPPRPLWPQAAIAARMSDIWRRATNAPLRIVGGSPWLAGLVALTAPDQPTIYANFDQIASPWVSDERLAREGVLVVWEDRDGLPPAGQALVGGRTAGDEDFRWSPANSAQPLKLHYVVVPPK